MPICSRFFSLLIVACLMALTGTAVHAQRVTIAIDGPLTASAEYLAGQRDKPAVLILHGFLQTNEFPSVRQLTKHLSDAGYTVLAPTLSLGIANRKLSLPCEAIHTHSMSDSIREIDLWLGWLKKRQTPIVLVGHSFGTIHLLAYLETHPDPAIRKLVGISLVEGSLHNVDDAQRERLLQELRRLAAQPRPTLVKRAISFCKQYQSTPQGLLSYMEWTPDRVIGSIDKIRLPMAFIMGSGDDRFGPGWLPRLKATSARVHVIAGANHFMDGQHEFDMLDRLLEELKGANGPGT